MFFAVGVVSFFTIKIYEKIRNKEPLFIYKKSKKSLNSAQELIQKRIIKLCTLLTCIGALLWDFCVFLIVMTATLDLPNVMHGKYQTVSCTTTGDSGGSHNGERYITCIDDYGKKISSIKYFNVGFIKDGSRVKIKYYSRIKIGEIQSVVPSNK